VGLGGHRVKDFMRAGGIMTAIFLVASLMTLHVLVLAGFDSSGRKTAAGPRLPRPTLSLAGRCVIPFKAGRI